jgi:arylsulfatase
VVAALGGTSAGWSLYIDDKRRPVFSYRNFEVQTAHLVGARPLSPGAHDLQVDFDYAGGLGGGGRLVLTVDGQAAAEETLKATPVVLYSINETFDVGLDTGSPGGRYPGDAPLGFPMPKGVIAEVTLSTP